MRTFIAFIALALTARPALAQRELHWRDLTVGARLEADGTLRVTERQTMVFTGDWNGGERRFNVRIRERFAFNRISRVDDGGGIHMLREGDLDAVDEYDFVETKTLRWRSRLPSDPPFEATPITYVLEYSYANVLKPGEIEGTWLLDHDFVFTDRDGPIENFSLLLELDSAWQATLPEGGKYRAAFLQPGTGFAVQVPLRYTGAGGPDVSVGAEPIERFIIAGVVLVLLGSLGRRLMTRERETGRLQPLPSPEFVDEKWLRENVFKHLPEAVGAAWDNSTDASEVAAVLARFVTEGRMKSEVKQGGFFQGPVLHLELLVEKSRFHGYERQLIDALFESHDRRTDTNSIKERYKKSGFNPAEKIKKPLKEIVQDLVPGPSPTKPPVLPSLVTFLGAVALMVIAVGMEPADAPVVLLGGLVIGACYLLGLVGAITWRNRVQNVGSSATMFLIPLGIATVALLAVLVTGFTLASAVALGGLAMLFFACANSLFNQARSRESVNRVEFRRRLATGRAYFVNELRNQSPRMKDEWFPYLIAFGLGKHMDRWFASFGGETHSRVGHSTFSSGSSNTGSSGSGWTGFGGGGGFSGGGASASWAAAAGSMAAGVSAPSSSSSSGGGGGGGSSGGGGGGGW